LYNLHQLPQLFFVGWFSGDGSGKAFYKFYGAWWEMCKSSDVHFKQVFDSEYSKLLDLMPQQHRASQWLNDYIYQTRMKWCYSWTWNCLTLGVHSTQRSESIHSVVAMLLHNNSTLIDVVNELERWAKTRTHQAQTNLYTFCTKVSTGAMQQGRLVQGMLKSFHEHAIKLVTANLHRAIEYNVVPVEGDSGYFIVKRPMESIQHSFLGPVQWIDENLGELIDRDVNNVSAPIVARVDRAVAVHDYFPLFRSQFVSNGTSCTCQYPIMQGLPCEHCLAVLVIKLQAEALPPCFLEQTMWHVESDATESLFRIWCMGMAQSRKAAPATAVPLSTPDSRFKNIMVTATMLARGYSLLVSDTELLQTRMSQMCIDLSNRHEMRQQQRDELEKQKSGAAATALVGKRNCTACHQPGHRSDNAQKCSKHAKHVPSFFDGQPSICAATAEVVQPPPPPVSATGAQISSADAATAEVVQPPPPPQPAPPQTVVVQPLVPSSSVILEQVSAYNAAFRVFDASRNIDQIDETKAQFLERLQASQLVPVAVAMSGECFWSACFLNLQSMAKRNLIWAAIYPMAESPLALRLQVLAFMKTNWTRLWISDDDNQTNFQETFEATVIDELKFGVANGRTGLTDKAPCVDEWFSLMSDQFAYSSTVCLFATALCFRITLKVWIRGSKYPEMYSSSKEYDEVQDAIHIVDPNTTICFCKGDRSSHFDACHWDAQVRFVPNLPTKSGKGRLRQARFHSSIETRSSRPKPKKTKP
jgi:hypothetical protein